MLSSRTNAGVVLLLVTAQVFAGVVLFETRRGLAGVRVELAENTRRTLDAGLSAHPRRGLSPSTLDAP
jgi:hypothetical protein